MTTPDTAAIRARLQAATWQPIETAPKDGTRIDLLAQRVPWRDPDREPIEDIYPDCFWGQPTFGTVDSGDPTWLGFNDPYGRITPMHWRIPLSQEDAAALLEAFDARGEEIERLRAEKIDALAGKQAELIADQDIEIARLRAQIAAPTAAAEGARAGALEEAAKVADRWASDAANDTFQGIQRRPARHRELAASGIAADIRTLAAGPADEPVTKED